MWEFPEAHRLFERLGRFVRVRVIRYDRRDSGLSDPIKDDVTLEAHGRDAVAVIDATGAQRPVLVGATEGPRSLALYAATRPELVGGLIAFAPTVRGMAAQKPELLDLALRALSALDYASVASTVAPAWADDPVRHDRLERYFQTCVTPLMPATWRLRSWRTTRPAPSTADCSDVAEAVAWLAVQVERSDRPALGRCGSNSASDQLAGFEARPIVRASSGRRSAG